MLRVNLLEDIDICRQKYDSEQRRDKLQISVVILLTNTTQ